MKTYRIEQKRIAPAIDGNTREARAVITEGGITVEILGAHWGTSANEVYERADAEARQWIKNNP